MHSRWQQVDPVFPAASVRAPVNRLEIGLEHCHHHLVGIVVIVAVLRRLIQQQLAQPFLACKVRLQCFQQIAHRHSLLVINLEFDR